jgi:hypothetical protein
MRKVAIVIAAAVSLLLAGSLVYRADATTGAGTLGLAATAKHYSQVEQATTCKGKKGPFCQPDMHLRCDPWCHCVPC